MTIRPVIFSTPMVQALLAGRKTQTRRLASSPLRRVEVGDLLWVREQWRTETDAYNDLSPIDMSGEEKVIFEADGNWSDNHTVGRHRQGMHMPRWASRLTLEVVRVRFDRLQAISLGDCYEEGIARPTGPRLGSVVSETDNARNAFRLLWNSLHGKPGEGWDCDPQIVALSFRVHRANVDQVAAGKVSA